MGQTRWVVDGAHSSVEFEVQHMSISVYRNRFRTLEGTLVLDDEHPERSSLEASVDLRSIDLAPGKFLDKLYGEEFFQVEKQPKMTYVSKVVERLDPHTWKVQGELTLRGVTHPLELAVEDRGSANSPFSKKAMRSFRARGVLRRSDFGITWNAPLDTGAMYLGEKVTLELHIELFEAGG